MYLRQHVLWRPFALLAIMALVLMAFAPAAFAAGPTISVVASGLDNPRGLAFGPEGALYVAEAGRGGSVGPFPSPEGPKYFGLSGAVTRVHGGQQERIVTGLPSLASADGSGGSGPVGISFQGRGGGFVTVGLGADPALRAALGADGAILGHLLQVPASGGWRALADVAGYESAANPAGGPVDSNPYGVLALPGKRIIADAGGNDLLQVDANGNISTLAVFPTLPVDPPPFPGFPGAESVPTTVAQGPDGAYYVGVLTGWPFPVGGAVVYRVPQWGGAPQVYAGGFTNIISIAFGADGSLYVLEIDHDGLLAGPPFGALIRVAPDGTRTTLAGGPDLVMPGGVAVGPDGALYVSNLSVAAGAGHVLRIAP